MNHGTLRVRSRRLATSAVGAAGAILIHALLVLSFVLSLSLPSPRRPDATGAGASSFASTAEPEMTVVFIDELAPVEDIAQAKPPDLASRGIEPPDRQLVVLSPDPLPAAAKTEGSDDAQDDPGAAEAAEHARLYGRYVGQVQARIERAWMRPRTEIGAPRFSCRARIRQDRGGAVVEVTLDHCSGTERWRQSLLSAVRTASPLPAPPDASVYVDILWLSFGSAPFEEGGSTEGFEPEAARTGLVRDSEIARQSFEQFATGARRMFGGATKEDSKVVHLTIIGTPATGTYPPKELPADARPPPLPPSPTAEAASQ